MFVLIEVLNLNASLAPSAYLENIEYALASNGILAKVSVKVVPSGANLSSTYTSLYSESTSTSELHVPSLQTADVVTEPAPSDSSNTPSY